MSAFRAILVGFIAISLSVLPVSAAEMRASMSAGMADMADHVPGAIRSTERRGIEQFQQVDENAHAAFERLFKQHL